MTLKDAPISSQGQFLQMADRGRFSADKVSATGISPLVLKGNLSLEYGALSSQLLLCLAKEKAYW